MNWFKKGTAAGKPAASQPPAEPAPMPAPVEFEAPSEMEEEVLRIGLYRVVRRLGGGGMGVVYQVETADGQTYALKAFKVGKAEDAAENLERFKREIAIGMDLSHPNVIRMVDWGVTDQSRPYIVLELLEGIPLSDYIRLRAPLGLDEARDIITFVLLGLEAIHNAGVIHRDLKPQNIFMCQNGSIKIMDFGIARKAGQKDITVTGTALGTSTFISPEQLMDTKHVDSRTDIFNVGLVLYQMLTNRLAFDAGSFAGIVKKVLGCSYTPISQVRPDLPPEVEEWLGHLICKELGQRYPTAREALNAIRF